jgi:Protein of unknown function (DUF3055)
VVALPRHIVHESYEESRSRFVTIVTDHSQYDLVVNYTSHFYGKALVLLVQTDRFGIFDVHEVQDYASFGRKLGVCDEEEARILSDYLEDVMPTIYTTTEN